MLYSNFFCLPHTMGRLIFFHAHPQVFLFDKISTIQVFQEKELYSQTLFGIRLVCTPSNCHHTFQEEYF